MPLLAAYLTMNAGIAERGMVESAFRAGVRRVRTVFRRVRYRFGNRTAGHVRLHLGCGQEYWPGYINVDADPAANADLCIDFMEIAAAFRQGSVSEAVMIHSLSYLGLWEARDFFERLARVMQPGGRVVIELPDLDKCAARAHASEGQLATYLEALRGMYAFDMEWIENRRQFTPYAFGWSGWHLKAELETAGFRDVTILEPQTHGARVWRDTRVEAIK